ncbi:MAG: acyloxyacyl hydrolase [Phycisphaerales bacterium]
MRTPRTFVTRLFTAALVLGGLSAAAHGQSEMHASVAHLAEAPVFRLVPAAPAATFDGLGRVVRQDAAVDAPAGDLEMALPTGEVDDSIVSRRVEPRFGDIGSTRFDLRAGMGWDVKTSDNQATVFGIGFSEFIEDGIAIRVELNGVVVNQRGSDAEGVNLNLLFEWHFYRQDTWSLFFDAGAGVLFTTDDVPTNGSSFNFTPQAGFGATFDIFDNARTVVGFKWHHVSNANTFDENPGRDHALLYAGLSFPF